VRTADCVPILVGDRQTRRVAAVHAGWRGVVQGVTPAAVEALLERGSRPEELIVAIGPHISLAAFEVGDEVARELAQASSARNVVTRHEGQKAHVSLAGIVRAQLTQLGVPNDHVEELPGCTFGDASRFFSYRRDGRQSGRQVSAIVSERII
jgi:YfiH family protein